MRYTQVPVGNNMPVDLVLFDDRTLMFVQVAAFEALLDQSVDGTGVEAFFYPEGFSLFRGETESKDFNYGVRYRYHQSPLMLAWLQQQNLQLPEKIIIVQM